MDALRKGELSADEFRAAVRASKQRNGEAAHEQFKVAAVAASNR